MHGQAIGLGWHAPGPLLVSRAIFPTFHVDSTALPAREHSGKPALDTIFVSALLLTNNNEESFSSLSPLCFLQIPYCQAKGIFEIKLKVYKLQKDGRRERKRKEAKQHGKRYSVQLQFSSKREQEWLYSYLTKKDVKSKTVTGDKLLYNDKAVDSLRGYNNCKYIYTQY